MIISDPPSPIADLRRSEARRPIDVRTEFRFRRPDPPGHGTAGRDLGAYVARHLSL